jgi:hypothetical protein
MTGTMEGAAADLGTTATPQQQAGAKLDALGKDEAWRGKLLSGDGPTVKQFHELMAAKSGEGNRVDQIVAGTAEVPAIQTTEGGVPIAAAMRAAADLRELGLSDDAIKQLLNSESVTEAEYRAVKKLRADLLADKDFVSALLSGNREALRDLLYANVVIVGGYGEKAA